MIIQQYRLPTKAGFLNHCLKVKMERMGYIDSSADLVVVLLTSINIPKRSCMAIAQQ